MKKDPKVKAEKESERQRFLDFIGPKPDLTEIAEKTGILRQTLYYITTGERQLSIDIHREMARAFPKTYDLNYQILGIRPEVKPADQSNKELQSVQSENERLRVENESLIRERDRLALDKANYWKLLENLHEQKLDFSAVSSQTTDTLFPMPKALPTSIDQINFESAYKLQGEKKPVRMSSWITGLVDMSEAIEV